MQYTEKPTLVTLKAEIKPEFLNNFAEWQSKLNAAITQFPGFISLEFLSPTGPQKDWIIVQRLENGCASEWLRSQQHSELITKLQNLAVPRSIVESVQENPEIHEGVTQVILAQVDKDKEEEFRKWTAKIHEEEAKFPGFRGVYVQSPNGGDIKSKTWITLLQFDTQDNLDNWLNSNERMKVLKQSDPLTTSMESHRVISPYAGWFASIAKTGTMPAAWKQTMIVLLVLFPIVMMEFRFLNPHLTGLNISLATFIGNAISVGLIAFPFSPIAAKLLKWWLVPKASKEPYVTIFGTLVVLAIYLACVVAFWSFV